MSAPSSLLWYSEHFLNSASFSCSGREAVIPHGMITTWKNRHFYYFDDFFSCMYHHESVACFGKGLLILKIMQKYKSRTKSRCPVLNGMPLHICQLKKLNYLNKYIDCEPLSPCQNECVSTCRQATRGGSTSPMLSPWTIVSTPMVLVVIPQEFWKASCFSPGLFGSSNTISNILEKF